jgi:hypothetical protein
MSSGGGSGVGIAAYMSALTAGITYTAANRVTLKLNVET